MIKVGITGQTGFIGTHLFNFLNLKKEEIITVPFEDNYFENKRQLKEFVSSCDAIVHLAALNRCKNPQVLYDTNVILVNQLILAMEETGSKPLVLFSSSIQEERENQYGKSKHDGRHLFEKWAQRNQARFMALVIPNVFGPFGKPYYNSVISTFCHQLTHNVEPKIEIDADIQLIFVGELVELFYQKIVVLNEDPDTSRYMVQYNYERKVSEILAILQNFKKLYLVEHCFPKLQNSFELNLFNTFRSYIDYSGHFPVELNKNADPRGVYVESVKTFHGGQFSYSITMPGFTRGNHFHTRKIERFIVLQGRATIEMRRIGTSDVLRFELDGNHPSFIDMPVWYTHNISNIGEVELITMFWINEFYDPKDSDTYFEKV